MICFYHSADFDGICSAAIVKRKYPDCYLYGINYGQDFPWGMIRKNEKVIMVDFSIQPFDGMIHLNDIADFVWIDHHISAIKEYEKAKAEPDTLPDFEIRGLREDGKAGCELTWEYLYPDEKMPISVEYLGRYDVWDHETYPDTVAFQYGMRSFTDDETRPYNTDFWDIIFSDDLYTIYEIIEKGEAILNFVESDYMRYVRSYSFEGTYDGYSAIFCNRGMTGSKLYDAVWDEEKYDLMVSFIKNPYGTWTVSLYTTRDDIDCGAIAKSKGGGGHRQAAGYQTEDLDFIVDMRPRSKDDK